MSTVTRNDLVTDPRTARIRDLNDKARQAWGVYPNTRVVCTQGIRRMSAETNSWIAEQVQKFDAFSTDNDPHGEHDFGSFDGTGAPVKVWRELAGEKVFWKFDYYDTKLEYGSEDPSDAAQTVRVLTIMLASEY